AGWVVFSVAIAFFSGFGQVAAAVAGVLLILYGRTDRWVRVSAVAVQAVAQLLLYRELQSASDLARIESQQANLSDGPMPFPLTPVDLGRELWRHFDRVVNAYPGGPRWLLPILTLAVLVGLITASLRSPRRAETIRARFLTTMLVIAIVGAF